jgi:hypothetical protein
VVKVVVRLPGTLRLDDAAFRARGDGMGGGVSTEEEELDPRNSDPKAISKSSVGICTAVRHLRMLASLMHPVKRCDHQKERHEARDRVLQTLHVEGTDRDGGESDQGSDL